MENIAVKINNEFEFDFLMQYYDKIGYSHWNNDSEFALGIYVEFKDDYAFLLEGQQNDYKVLSVEELKNYIYNNGMV